MGPAFGVLAESLVQVTEGAQRLRLAASLQRPSLPSVGDGVGGFPWSYALAHKPLRLGVCGWRRIGGRQVVY